MNNLDVAEKLVIVRKTARGLWAIYVPGLPGLRTLREVFTDRSEANARARRIIIDVMEILNAADRVRGPAVMHIKLARRELREAKALLKKVKAAVIVRNLEKP